MPQPRSGESEFGGLPPHAKRYAMPQRTPGGDEKAGDQLRRIYHGGDAFAEDADEMAFSGQSGERVRKFLAEVRDDRERRGLDDPVQDER